MMIAGSRNIYLCLSIEKLNILSLRNHKASYKVGNYYKFGDMTQIVICRWNLGFNYMENYLEIIEVLENLARNGMLSPILVDDARNHASFKIIASVNELFSRIDRTLGGNGDVTWVGTIIDKCKEEYNRNNELVDSDSDLENDSCSDSEFLA